MNGRWGADLTIVVPLDVRHKKRSDPSKHYVIGKLVSNVPKNSLRL